MPTSWPPKWWLPTCATEMILAISSCAAIAPSSRAWAGYPLCAVGGLALNLLWLLRHPAPWAPPDGGPSRIGLLQNGQQTLRSKRQRPKYRNGLG